MAAVIAAAASCSRSNGSGSGHFRDLGSLWRWLLLTCIDKARRIVVRASSTLSASTKMKIVGVLLITALLIIPAAAARRFASGPEQMAILAALIGVAGVFGGLFGSLEWDTPAGPSIVVAALGLFIISILPIPFMKAYSSNTNVERSSER